MIRAKRGKIIKPRAFNIKFKGLLYVFLLLFIISCNSTKLSQEDFTNEFSLTTEEQLSKPESAEKIENFYLTGVSGSFQGKDSVPIYFINFTKENSKGSICISSGRTEAAIKYKELIYDLYNQGYSIYILDHRGQGFSGRMTEDSEMGYIDDFQFYVDDLKMFYDNHIKPQNHSKNFLLAHSMGGAIGMTYLEQYPVDFNAAVFSSPMLDFKLGYCSGAKAFGSEKPKYGLGQGNYEKNKASFNKNKLTGSELRYNRMIEAFDQETSAQIGGATYSWVIASCNQFKYINAHINDISIPFLIFSAENEQIVKKGAHKHFIKKARELGKTCELYEVANAQHELLIEKDPQRIHTINTILHFFKAIN